MLLDPFTNNLDKSVKMWFLSDLSHNIFMLSVFPV